MALYNSYTDEQLLALLQGNDEGAFTALYERYWDKLFVIASHALKSSQDAEDALHDVFVRIWQRRAALVIEKSLSHYLAVSIKFEIISRLRKQYRRENLLKAVKLAAPVAEDPTGEWLREKELLAELEATIQSLPEKCSIVFRYSRQQGYSTREIAEELHVSENTVLSHMSRALHTMRLRFKSLLSIFPCLI